MLEIVILHEGNVVVVIEDVKAENQAAFTSEHVFLGSRHCRSKKIVLNPEAPVLDVISLGDSTSWPISERPPLSSSHLTTSDTSPIRSRFVSVGKQPLVSFFCRDPDSAFSLTSFVAEKVTSAVSTAVFSFAKSFFAAPTEESREGGKSVKAETLVPFLSLSDGSRQICQVSFPFALEKGMYAALIDTLGRVLLVDVDEGELFRIIKGARHAKVGWVSWDNEYYLIIYTARGVLEIFRLPFCIRVAAFNVGPGQHLVQVINPPRKDEPHELGCLLVSQTGAIRNVAIDVPLDQPMAVDPKEMLSEIRRKWKDIGELDQNDTIQAIKTGVSILHQSETRYAASRFIMENLPLDLSAQALLLLLPSEEDELRTSLDRFVSSHRDCPFSSIPEKVRTRLRLYTIVKLSKAVKVLMDLDEPSTSLYSNETDTDQLVDEFLGTLNVQLIPTSPAG
ncbi:Rab3 GTPase-activating protein non-catalytic subunit, partial [Dinochytrium kinnereticum]